MYSVYILFYSTVSADWEEWWMFLVCFLFIDKIKYIHKKNDISDFVKTPETMMENIHFLTDIRMTTDRQMFSKLVSQTYNTKN